MGSFITRIKVKEYISSQHVRISKDFMDALEEKVKEIIDKAIERARANQRNTVMPRDL